jgi:hypothetical protein
MSQATALATKARSSPARPRRALDHHGVIAVLAPVRAISARASEIEQLLDANRILPEDESTYPVLLASLPTPQDFADAIMELESVLSRAATTPECQALIVMLLDAIGSRVDGGAKNRVRGYAMALMNNGLDDDVAISATVLGLAIARQLKTCKRPPLPSRLVEECISVREKVETVLYRLQDSEGRSANLRMWLEWRIAGGNDFDGSVGDTNYIAW